MSISSIPSGQSGVPDVMAWEEVIEITGVTPEHLQELVALGWIESRPGETRVLLLKDTDIYKVRKLERICGDFELPVIGGTIIVDLLDRIDRLERLVAELNKLED